MLIAGMHVAVPSALRLDSQALLLLHERQRSPAGRLCHPALSVPGLFGQDQGNVWGRDVPCSSSTEAAGFLPQAPGER